MEAPTSFVPSGQCHRGTRSTVLLSVVALCMMLTLLIAPAQAVSLVQNDDLVLAYGKGRLYAGFLDTLPTLFEPTSFIQDLFILWGTLVEDVDTIDKVSLLMWCGSPNTTMNTMAVYCPNGMDTYPFAPYTYVLLNVITSTDPEVAGIDFTKVGFVSAPVLLVSDTALRNPDLTAADYGGGFVSAVASNTAAVWAIFGCLIGLVLFILIGLAVCRCRRDKDLLSRNHGMMKRAIESVRFELAQMSVNTASRGGAAMDAAYSSASRRYQANTGGSSDMAARYNFNVDNEDEHNAPATRASPFWPGASGSAVTAGRPTSADAVPSHMGREAASMDEFEMQTRSPGGGGGVASSTLNSANGGLDKKYAY